MRGPIKDVSELTVDDCQKFPVWEWVNDDSLGETMVRPVEKLPAKHLEGRIVYTEVQLANGSKILADICNVSARDSYKTKLFLTFTARRGKDVFFLARYFDITFERHGPTALAEFLGLDVDDVFPISYDLRPNAEGDEGSLVGTIDKEPVERLTSEQINKVIFSR